MSDQTAIKGKLIKSGIVLSVLGVFGVVYCLSVSESTYMAIEEPTDPSPLNIAGKTSPLSQTNHQTTTPENNSSKHANHTEAVSRQPEQQVITPSERAEPPPVNNLLSLDDEALISLHDVLENSFVPVFVDSADSENSLDQQAAIDILLSRLPENMGRDAFLQLNSLMRDYLPYDLADSLTTQIQTDYLIEAKQQAYLQQQGQVESMEQQVAMAEHLQKLSVSNDTTEVQNQAISTELAEWQAFENILKHKGDDVQDNTRIRELITNSYDQRVADDYIELSEIENDWLQRYALYQAEKQVIVQSGLSQADKAEQIEALIQQHYEEKEWAAVRGYDELMASQADQGG